ncbi:MAG: hypothetical protein ACK4M3_07900 [Pyrobaculum sp.]
MLKILLLLLAAGYLAINLVGLPPLLVAENMTLAAIYLALAFSKWRHAPLLTASVALFNAGRVSRTIWSPTAGFGTLAWEHVPLFLYLLLVAAIAIRTQLRQSF